MKNKYEIRGDVTAIFLNHRGLEIETIIDTKDLTKVQEFPNLWHTRWSESSKTYYVEGKKSLINDEKIRKTEYLSLHRVVMDTPHELVVDHINHNGLDNRKINLRNVTRKANTQNKRGARSDSKSGVRGVSWHKQIGKWRVYIHVDGKLKTVGYFEDLEEAKIASDKARAVYLPDSLINVKIDSDEIIVDPARPPSNNTSGVKNVRWHKGYGRWQVYFKYKTKGLHLGWYDNIDEAKLAAKKAREIIDSSSPDDIWGMVKEKYKGGVTYDNGSGKWTATFSFDKKRYNLGIFTDKIDAETIIDTAHMLKQNREELMKFLDVTKKSKRVAEKQSGIDGIYWNKTKWMVRIKYSGGFASLGSYAELEKAKSVLKEATSRIANNDDSISEMIVKKQSSSDIPGVVWNERTKKWVGWYKKQYLGYFHTKEEAAKVVEEAKKNNTK